MLLYTLQKVGGTGSPPPLPPSLLRCCTVPVGSPRSGPETWRRWVQGQGARVLPWFQEFTLQCMFEVTGISCIKLAFHFLTEATVYSVIITRSSKEDFLFLHFQQSKPESSSGETGSILPSGTGEIMQLTLAPPWTGKTSTTNMAE